MRALLTTDRPIVAFLAKLLLAYAAWFVAYDLWLLPDGRLDAAVARNAAALSGGLLNVLGVEAAVNGRVVLLASMRGVEVVDNCTGLAVVGLFLGFVLAYPGRRFRRAFFLPLGAVAIHLANVGRIAFLAWFLDERPSLFDPVHQWGAMPFFYAVVFVLWMVWAHYGAGRERPKLRPVLQPAAG